jgi:starch synthase
MHIVMIAAENDALPGGKVGGIGDVIRDLPPALAGKNHHVSVVTPGYRFLSKTSRATQQTRFQVEFRGKKELLELYRVEAPKPHTGVTHWVVEHDLFAAGGPGTIYCIQDREPFATDADKFVLFCTAVAEALVLGLLESVDVLHCHDWHAAPLLLLRQAAPRYRCLQTMLAVYSIHNLSIQGIRPLANNASSLAAWFPGMLVERGPVADPRHPNCINWMRTGINLADKVHAVSPNYAKEILLPTDEKKHFIGGEHLEMDLQVASKNERLVGILNGCDYSQTHDKPVGKSRLCQMIEAGLAKWVGDQASIPSAHFHALQRLSTWRQKRKLENFVVTSVGRLAGQKNRLLCERLGDRSVMEILLARLSGDGFFIMLGSGDPRYEEFFTRIMATHDNFLFLQGYSDELSAALYTYGDLFLMPSSFEPCGISQMLAMRAGTPCLVHAVGGLADTVQDGVNGFTFRGDDLAQQAENLIKTFVAVMKLKKDKPPIWRELSRAASAARFTWESSATALLKDVFSTPLTLPPGKLRNAVSSAGDRHFFSEASSSTLARR